MSSDDIRLCLPARPDFARSVRMLASTLAVANAFSVDDVEDVRMAAEEGFVYACSSGVEVCDVTFALSAGELTMDFALGSDPTGSDDEGEDLDLVELLLDAVCDEFLVTDGVEGSVLHLVKRAAHVG